MEQRSAGGDILLRVEIAVDAGAGRSGRLRRQQVILEGAMVAATGNPNVRTTQAIAQDSKNGRLIETPVGHSAGEDHPTPPGWQEGQW